MMALFAVGCEPQSSTVRSDPPAVVETASAAPSSEAAAASPEDQSEKIVKSEAQWKQELTPEQFYILRQKGTERAFSHPYHDMKKPGKYLCAGCGALLFTSHEKFDSGCGWPSFYDPATNDAIVEKQDTSHGMVRTEVLCAKCGGHLGHVFADAPNQPTGLRYCINGGAIEHVPADDADK